MNVELFKRVTVICPNVFAISTGDTNSTSKFLPIKSVIAIRYIYEDLTHYLEFQHVSEVIKVVISRDEFDNSTDLVLALGKFLWDVHSGENATYAARKAASIISGKNLL